MNKTLINEMKKLDNSGLNDVIDLARELMVINGKMTFKPGMKVFMVQKTKKTPGVIVRILQKNAVGTLNSGRNYRVPMSMLEAA